MFGWDKSIEAKKRVPSDCGGARFFVGLWAWRSLVGAVQGGWGAVQGGWRAVQGGWRASRAAAWRFGPQAASRNSIAGLVEVNHCPFEHRPSLRAVGNDSPNDAKAQSGSLTFMRWSEKTFLGKSSGIAERHFRERVPGMGRREFSQSRSSLRVGPSRLGRRFGREKRRRTLISIWKREAECLGNILDYPWWSGGACCQSDTRECGEFLQWEFFGGFDVDREYS